MRRVGTTALLTLLLVALVGVPASAARPDATFHARSSDARQGGTLRLWARVAHPVRGTEFSATAVVHFACTDVTVDLLRFGRAYLAGAGVDVAADEAPGEVAVEVTITYGDETVVVPTTSTIRARRGAPPSPDCEVTQ